MRKTIGLLMSLFTSLWVFAAAPELQLLDELRGGSESVKVRTRIELVEHGVLQSTSVMDVYVGEDQRSLAVYRSEREAGQKVLVAEGQFWLFLPGSKRAMRITPMQKMLGEASVGDVASLRWQDDYKVLSRQAVDDLIELELAARHKNLSYSRITLWVDAESLMPQHADLYLKSGKLAKQAEFLLQQEQGQWRIVGMSLLDRVQSDQLTTIYYDSIEAMDMQARWFSPAFLLHGAP